jgi:hypothetical protein
MGHSRGNYNDWKRGQSGGGQGRQPEPPGPPKYREHWCLVDPQAGINPTLVFQSKTEAERTAARLNQQHGRAYEVQKVDEGKPLRPESPTLSNDVPDPERDLVYSLLQTQASKYNVTGEPDSPFCYLTFLVRDGENEGKKISVEMDTDEMLHLAEYIFATLGKRL